MPTYDYLCSACGHKFEEFQSISAPLLKKCPACKQNKLKRLIGVGAGVIFKGGGFYETDYRSESYKNAEKADKEAGSPKTESKSDSKTEAKSDAPKTEPKVEAKAETKSETAPAPKAETPKAESKPAKSESKPAKKSKA